MKKQSRNLKKRLWTSEEETILMESFGVASIKYLMGKLKRSEESIKYKYRRMTGSVDPNLAGGMISPVEIAEVFHVSHRTVLYWIHHKGLVYKQLNRTSKTSDKNHRYYIDPFELWKWVKKNKKSINFSLITRGVILPEPEWLEQEIKQATLKKRQISWTIEEEEAAYFMWQNGVHYSVIAKKLKRSEKGTQRRLTLIRQRKGDPTHRRVDKPKEEVEAYQIT